ncbi:MAG: HNH endonuclease [Sulfuriflexus sp.]|nr:HNH endonuclease [Sulfuriflexus sp.]
MKNKMTVILLKCSKIIASGLLLFALGVQPTYSIEKITYYHNDGLGSPVAGTDESGALLWKEDYKPYGERIRKQSESDTNTRWFTGHPEDKETGFVYAGARHYDPVIGRFMAIDPIGFDEDNLQMFNRYAYANNNPYKYVDPDGGLPILLLIPVAIKAIDAGITAYDTYNAYQQGGALGAAQELGVSAVASILPGAKIARKLTQKTGLPKPPRGKGSVPPSERDPIRVLSKKKKGSLLNDRGGKCEGCGKKISVDEARGHHIKRHADGGRTNSKNTAILCDPCHKNIHKK